jgi:2-aminoadipate transaminase
VQGSPVRDLLALTEQPGFISFAGGLPDPGLFDGPGLRAAFDRALAGDAAARSLQYSTTEGDPRLRAQIARLLDARGLPTDPDDVLVTSGSQQALTLISTLLVEPGDVVLVEDPSYLAALQSFELAGARVVPVACDEDGLVPEALERAIRDEHPAFVYVIPNFQNPTGRTLAADRRVAVADIAARHGVWLVEDDPYGELRYEGDALPPLAGLRPCADRTLALSTLSKVAAPGLRIGWVRAGGGVARDVHRALVIAKQAADLHSSTIDQAAAAIWLAETDLPAHVARLRAVYGARRDVLLAGLERALPPGTTWNRPTGGMFVWARLAEGWDAEALLRDAVAREVAFVPGTPFYAGAPDPRTLRLSFTAHAADEIAEGLARLRSAWA